MSGSEVSIVNREIFLFFEDGTIIFWKNSKGEPNEFKKYDMKRFGGPVWRISWSLAGELLAVSSSENNIEHIVEVYKVRYHQITL